MLFYLFIYFKIIPPRKVDQNSKKNIKRYVHECKDLIGTTNYQYGPEITNNYFTVPAFAYCGSSDVTFYNNKFKNFKVKNDPITSNAYLFHTNNVNMNVTSNSFTEITMHHTLIYCNGDAQLFTMVSNIINDCHSFENTNATIVEVFVQNTDIRYNSIFFNLASTKGRAFRIKYHTGCKLIGNHITNALYSQGCAVYFEQCSDNSPPLEISDCVFTSCLGDNSAIFYLANLNSKLTITNVTFEKSKNKPVVYNGYFINIGAIENHKPCVVFDGCKFSYLESNANGGGAIGLWLKGSNDNIVSNLTFYNTQFEHLQFQSANNGNRVAHGGGALCFDNQVTNKQVELFVIGCTFTNVSSFASGGAINFNTPGHTLYVEDCNFSNTFTVNSGQKGGAIYAKVVSNVMPIIIKGCQFQNTQSNTGGALYIERSATSNSDINIFDCTFDHVSSSAEGHAIHIASSTLDPITISFCHIVDCGTARNTASVYLDASKFEFSDNEVTFSDVANSCGCLKARRSSSHVYRNNVFSNSRQDYNDKSRWISAGIHDNSPNTNANYFEIENNTFDNIFGNNQGRCFLIEKVIDIKIKGNSIQNCPEGAFYIKVIFNTKKEEFSIEDCKFINNTIGNHWFSSFGINPQIWIQNKGPATGSYYQLTLNFVNCYFENNFNQKKGGALWYGKMEYNADTKVVINHCQFVNNRATEDGGALALYPYYGCEIIDCEFIRNRSDQGKGAIYIETDFSSPKKAEITIEGCKFEDNEGTNYSCISFNNVANTPISITNNNFTNCGSNGYVILIPTNMKTLNIESNNITYDKNTNSGGISINSTGNINIIDTNFKSTRTNPALMINSIQSTETTTNEININGCSFDQCDKNNNNNGDSLYITDSNSDKVIISYCYFIDCGTDSSKYSIYFDISNFEFIYNEITFSDPTRSCRCIKNNKVTEHLYRGNIFRNSRNNGNYNSACIDESTSNSNANVLVEDNIFDYIVGPSQGRCIFINCNQNAEINVRNNTIKNLPSGGFYIKIAAIKCTFETCKFINNSVSDRWLGTLGLTPQIWIETSMTSDISNEVTLIFNGCYFENNYSPKQGGGISYGKSKHVCNTNLEFHECKFIENRSGESGSALSLISYQGCNIDNCEFIRNRSGSGSGCIYIETEFNCKENNKRPSSLHPVINIHQCLFDNNVGIESSSMTIGTTKNTPIHIDGCLFTNEESGSVILIPLYNQQTGTSLTETLKLDNNTFDSITCNEQGNCINIKYGLSEGLVIRNNTIQNCPSGGFYFKIEFTIKINEFKIDTCQFINNTVSETWSSTDSEIDPQIWIQNNKAGTSNFYNQLTLSFDNCYFENNYNPVNGGALYYGKNKYLSNTKIIMNECIFVSNQAKGEGGAISLFIYQGSEINKCEFTRNRSEGGKGAIYIETDFPCSADCPSATSRKAEITIEGCKFEDNEGTNYSCISFNNVANTPISITNNNFTNCGSNGYVILIPTNMKTLNIESNNITYDKNTNSGGISISSTGNINIIDTNFKSTRTNSALMINSIQSTETTTNEININGCSFDRCGISSNNDDSAFPTTEKTALSIESSSNSLGVIIDYCIFDSCSSINNNCFDFSISPTSFAFKNSVLKGMKGTGCNNYLGSLTFNNQFSLVLQNISFIDNSFKSLYGGGIGLMFKGLSQLQFDNCNFVNNEAIQDTTTSRPNEESKPPYFNGDGGAIQLGYICSMRDMKVIFSKCDFERNKAQRHGGAISIQTLNTVELIECTFNENKANYDFGSELLFTNYYEKKLEGRGGAIYLNPIFTYSGDSECQSPTSFMSSVNIDKCTFTSNTAYDGFAFYVEGDASTTFTVNGNNFINNYDLEMLKRNSSIIATEVCFSTYEDIVAKNSFENKDENGAKVTVLEFSCVDHNGNQIPTKVFTNSLEFSFSEFFSHSEKFSKSDHFSNSNKFTESSGFSKSGYFSNSESFSISKQFSESNKFSGSNEFSKTRGFSFSKDFSKSSEFSVSSDFSKSNQFSNSKQFTESDKFSDSRVFSETKPFSFTSLFSYSSSFSISSDFSKSNQFSISKQFSQSNKFTGTQIFSETKDFTKTEAFSISTIFTSSYDFTKSSIFSPSLVFSTSAKFSKSSQFSNTGQFTETNDFSRTIDFSLSHKFSVSNDFSQSGHFTGTTKFSYSKDFTNTEFFTRTDAFTKTSLFSVSSEFSLSGSFTQSRTFSLSLKFSHSKQFTETNRFSDTSGFSSSVGFSESEFFTPSASLIPSNPSCGIVSDDGSSNFTQSGRCDYSELEGKNITVQILSSNFTDYYDDDEGAAIRVVNCKFKGNGTYFYNCVSTKSGGAIYISNSNTDIVNNISLQYCQFIRCEADFGGAVFIHSGNAENEILILCCLFLENRCNAGKSSNISSYGGSAVFLSVAAVDVVNCTFEKSKGKGGAFKIVNPTKKKNLLEENKQISFSGCEFNNEGIENGEFSNAIYYIGSNKGSVVDVKDCNFKGKLNSNNHYIDGKITENNSPKFNINSCKFQYEFNISVKTDLVIKASSIEVVNEIPNNEKTVSSNFPKLIFCISFLMASFLLMFIRMNKLKLQKQNEIDNFFIDNVEINI